MRENLVLQIFFGFERNAARLQFFEHLVVILGVDYHRDVLIILRRRPDHCRAADIDIFDTRREIGAAFERCLERIEIDADYIDCVDIQLFELRHMLGVGAHCKQARMHVGVQGFNSAVEAFGKARDIGYSDNFEPRLFQRLCRAARRNYFKAVFNQPFAKFNNARLVRNADKRPLLHFHKSNLICFFNSLKRAHFCRL